jgi:hypothetical protein
MHHTTVARQRFGKNVTAAKNTHKGVHLLNSFFSMASLFYQRKVDEWFFTELLVIPLTPQNMSLFFMFLDKNFVCMSYFSNTWLCHHSWFSHPHNIWQIKKTTDFLKITFEWCNDMQSDMSLPTFRRYILLKSHYEATWYVLVCLRLTWKHSRGSHKLDWGPSCSKPPSSQLVRRNFTAIFAAVPTIPILLALHLADDAWVMPGLY